MLLLDEFTDWEPSEQWSDVTFFFKHDPDIEKIAVVGESRWYFPKPIRKQRAPG